MEQFFRARADINLDNILHNVGMVRSSLQPGVKLLGIVKADAYGHGDIMVARTLAEGGVSLLGVSNIDEARRLREGGIDLPILILGYTPVNCARRLAEDRIIQTVYSAEYAAALSQAAVAEGITLECHAKIDTGMARLGFDALGDPAAAADALEAAVRLPGLHFVGAFTHFATADEAAESAENFTRLQFSRFMRVLRLLEERGIRFDLRHCCNSAAALRYPEMQLDCVRAGVVLYGLAPDGSFPASPDLRPAMSLHAAVSMVKEIPAGASVSYGRAFTAQQPMRIATIPVGYADGYSRLLSGKGKVLLGGGVAPILGKICMDQFLVDVSHLPQVKMGDEAILFGRDGENILPIESLADTIGTINYEICCVLGRRVPRVYYKNGAAQVEYNYIIKPQTDVLK